MKKLEIKLRDLFDFVGASEARNDEVFESDREIFVETMTGDFTKINGFIRKSDDKTKIILENDISFICGKNHILIEDNECVYAKDVNAVLTDRGYIGVKERIDISDSKDVYDIAIDYPHLYKTPNGVIHHNTTIAKAVCNELDIDTLVINCSEERGIDTLRTTIRSFASTVSFHSGKVKCVIFDESDGMTSINQNALRGFIEEFSSNCRFIFTANFENRIIDAIKSRCVNVDFQFSRPERKPLVIEFDRRIQNILNEQKIEFNRKDIAEVVSKFFPDFRKTLNELQRHAQSGKIQSDLVVKTNDASMRSLMGYLKDKNFKLMRKWVAENPDCELGFLQKYLFDNSNEFVKEDYVPSLVLCLNEYDFKHSFCMSKEINIVAMLTQIMTEHEFL